MNKTFCNRKLLYEVIQKCFSVRLRRDKRDEKKNLNNEMRNKKRVCNMFQMLWNLSHKIHTFKRLHTLYGSHTILYICVRPDEFLSEISQEEKKAFRDSFLVFRFSTESALWCRLATLLIIICSHSEEEWLSCGWKYHNFTFMCSL